MCAAHLTPEAPGRLGGGSAAIANLPALRPETPDAMRPVRMPKPAGAAADAEPSSRDAQRRQFDADVSAQNDLLDQLGAGLDRSAAQAATIRTEVDHQNEFLDKEFGRDVEEALDRVGRTNDRTRALIEAGGVCRLHVVNAALFITLVLEVILGLQTACR